jgi:hypothetical protein
MTHRPPHPSAAPASATDASARAHGAPRRAVVALTLVAALSSAAALAVLATRAPSASPADAPASAARVAAPGAQDDAGQETAPEPEAQVNEGDPAPSDPNAPDPNAPDPDAPVAEPLDPNAPTPVPEQVAIAAAYPLAALLPEAELVFGPTLFGFDVAAFAAAQGGYLTIYSEAVGDKVLSGPAVVNRVAREHSLSPRLLLALLELESGWVREQTPLVGQDPLGIGEPGLYAGLSRMAETLGDTYYARRAGGGGAVVLADGKAVDVPAADAPSLAVLAWLSRSVPAADWAGMERPSRFGIVWQELYGDPPLFFGNLPVRDAPAPPALELPFGFGQRWYAIAGPQAPRGAAAPAAEIAFAPPPAAATGCFGSVEAVTAPIAGRVRWSEPYGVLLDPDLDNDGWEGTGWSLVLRHLSPVGRIPGGRGVGVGMEMGFPYCEDGRGQTRVSLALRYDGAWVALARPGAPLTVGGYLVGELGLGRPGFPTRSYNPSKVDGLNDIAALLE